MELCESLAFLKIFYIIKRMLSLVSIVAPLILMITIMVNAFKLFVSKDIDFKKFISDSSKRLVAAVVVFVIPAIVGAIFGALLKENNPSSINCFNNVTSETIKSRELEKEISLARQREADKQSAQNMQYGTLTIPENNFVDPGSTSNSEIPESKSLKPIVNGVQRDLNEGDCMNLSDKCACPTIGRFNGFYFTMATSTGRDMKNYIPTGGEKMTTVTVKCSDDFIISKSVNIKVKTHYENAFNNVCKLATTGINGVKLNKDVLDLDGTLVKRTTSKRNACSFHAYGSAIDINYKLTINVNGKDYKPYSSQGEETRNTYDAFVSALGREDDIRNVNYILWKYAFEPFGFTWGGNWSAESFDPMHFEISK